MKSGSLFFVVMNLAMFAFVSPPSMTLAAEFHVTDGDELMSVLFDEVGSNGEDDIVYLAAGSYFQSISDLPPRGGFVASAGGNSLTIKGEPGTSASDVIIDANGILSCLSIIDSSLHPSYTDLPYETVSDPEFDRPQIVVSGITIQNGDYEHLSGGLDIYAHKYDVTVKDCIIKNNSSGEGRGGGLSITAAFNLALENNQIYDNTVHETRIYTGSGENWVEEMISRGGGIYVSSPSNGLVVRNNIIAGNVAIGDSSEGGGMYLEFSCGKTAQLINNTIYGNIANEGGGIHFTDIPSPGGTINLYNNIIYANMARCSEGSADLYFRQHPDTEEGWRITVNAFNNNFSQALGIISASDDNLDTDPLFVDPVAGDFHLAPRSPMFNAGRNIVPDPPGLPEHDFEGDARVNGGTPDIGADEYYPGRASGGLMSAGLKIRSHGKDGPVVTKLLGKARLTISLAANDDKGKMSTLWVVMNSPIGRYFLTDKGWIKEKAVYYKGRLKDILPIDLPTPPPLAKQGKYEFWFSMEIQRPIKGIEKSSSKTLLSDSVVLHVAENNRKKPILTTFFNKKTKD